MLRLEVSFEGVCRLPPQIRGYLGFRENWIAVDMVGGPTEAVEAIEHFIGRGCSYMKVSTRTLSTPSRYR